MASLSQARCFNHANREAAARCPSCGRFFCRECVSEHERRMLCAACMAEAGMQGATRHWGLWQRLVRGVQFLAALLVLWLAFAVVGQLLLTAPSAYHAHTFADESSAAEGP